MSGIGIPQLCFSSSKLRVWDCPWEGIQWSWRGCRRRPPWGGCPSRSSRSWFGHHSIKKIKLFIFKVICIDLRKNKFIIGHINLCLTNIVYFFQCWHSYWSTSFWPPSMAYILIINYTLQLQFLQVLTRLWWPSVGSFKGSVPHKSVSVPRPYI